MTELPTDDILTEDGMASRGPGPILLIACGALAHEIVALKRRGGWDHMVLQCLPANLHHYPDKIVPAVEKMVHERRADYDRIFVVYADCGTGGLLEAACERLGVEMIEGPHSTAFSRAMTSLPRAMK